MGSDWRAGGNGMACAADECVRLEYVRVLTLLLVLEYGRLYGVRESMSVTCSLDARYSVRRQHSPVLTSG